MPKPVILLILTVVCGVGGFALGEISQMTSTIRAQGTNEAEENVVFAAGQFTIPLFEGGRVPFFLLTEVNIEVATYDEVSLLSNNRPHVRATILETLFELERRGEIKPDTIKPEVIKKAVQEDLEATFDLGEVNNVLLNRLLIQETGGRVRP
ncbi:hypothetical protein [Parvularcula lutaonensis]|uniref:Flagellar basal body-associated FliL family protein n=1 Tax=Parvularcula lutaonensis TaxID=491923 RepID=A0ABV7MD74_9PROT|nr:hypothetical protein [Parvularcula lutaonensis]GGY50652.1 hypothetical protein GCM10007148_19320 [Parvularcula lutaonensis]